MWTLTQWTVIVTALILCLAYALHRWVGIRRSVMGDRFTDRADTFWGMVWAWARRKWDLAAAAVIALAPVIWSMGLDTVVIAANLLANWLPALSGVDLSKLMISDRVQTLIQIGAVTIPPLRDAVEKLRAK